MNSLPARILAAVLTFSLGVGLANLWLSRNTNVVVCRFPAEARPASRLEMVFVLDTTGSMGGLLDGAKQRIWGIVNGVMQDSHASVRIGLVAYRDHSDEYVTRVLPLTDDLDKVYTTLMDYQASGGGDAPEDVRTALADSVDNVNWSEAAPDLAQIIFLVGDAPPHEDYNEVDTLTTAANAARNGIIVNTVQCGFSAETMRAWQAIANRGGGQYFKVPADGGVLTIATPYDAQLGDLASQLGRTFVPYGFGSYADGEAKRAEASAISFRVEDKIAQWAPAPARADRAANKVISSAASANDLFQQIENGSLKVDDVDPSQLPEALSSLSPSERRQEIEKRLAQRSELRHQISLLSRQRYSYIEAERMKRYGSEAYDEGFDVVVLKALKEQMWQRTK